MIKVNVERTKQKAILAFSMNGHADAGPHGKDLVCAGASAVSFGTVNAIAQIVGVELAVELKEDGGFLRCTVPNGLEADVYEKVQLLLEGMIVALRSIEQEYRQHIKIIDPN